MKNLRITVIVSSCLFAASANAQNYGPDFQAVFSSEKELGQIVRDVLGSMRGMPDRAGTEHACLDSTLRGAVQLHTVFSHYKYGVAMWSVLSDETERRKVALVLKFQTAQAREEIRITRERINGAVGTCSRFPLSVAKGTELLGAMKKADEVVRRIESGL